MLSGVRHSPGPGPPCRENVCSTQTRLFTLAPCETSSCTTSRCPLRAGADQRVLVAIDDVLDAGAALEQNLRDAHMAAGRRRNQRIAVAGKRLVDVGTTVQQQTSDFEMTALRGCDERRPVARHPQIDVGPTSQQRLDDIEVTELRGRDQRAAIAWNGVYSRWRRR